MNRPRRQRAADILIAYGALPPAHWADDLTPCEAVAEHAASALTVQMEEARVRAKYGWKDED